MKTEENTLYLPINQEDFDKILNGEKDKEYRAITPTTVTNFIQHQEVAGKAQLLCNRDLISETNFDMFANDYMYYNDGVFPYIPKKIMYLELGVGYRNQKDKMTVEVADISFEPGKDEDGNKSLVLYDDEGKPYKDEKGKFTMWNIIFHLGEIVEKDLEQERE